MVTSHPVSAVTYICPICLFHGLVCCGARTTRKARVAMESTKILIPDGKEKDA